MAGVKSWSWTETGLMGGHPSCVLNCPSGKVRQYAQCKDKIKIYEANEILKYLKYYRRLLPPNKAFSATNLYESGFHDVYRKAAPVNKTQSYKMQISIQRQFWCRFYVDRNHSLSRTKVSTFSQQFQETMSCQTASIFRKQKNKSLLQVGFNGLDQPTPSFRLPSISRVNWLNDWSKRFVIKMIVCMNYETNINIHVNQWEIKWRKKKIWIS